jgi:hypothetical protein
MSQILNSFGCAGIYPPNPGTWRRVNALVDTKRPRDYDAAVQLLSDLRHVSGLKGRETVFTRRIAPLREAHAKTSTLLTRLTKAGL